MVGLEAIKHYYQDRKFIKEKLSDENNDFC